MLSPVISNTGRLPWVNYPHSHASSCMRMRPRTHFATACQMITIIYLIAGKLPLLQIHTISRGAQKQDVAPNGSPTSHAPESGLLRHQIGPERPTRTTPPARRARAWDGTYGAAAAEAVRTGAERWFRADGAAVLRRRPAASRRCTSGYPNIESEGGPLGYVGAARGRRMGPYRPRG